MIHMINTIEQPVAVDHGYLKIIMRYGHAVYEGYVKHLDGSTEYVGTCGGKTGYRDACTAVYDTFNKGPLPNGGELPDEPDHYGYCIVCDEFTMDMQSSGACPNCHQL